MEQFSKKTETRIPEGVKWEREKDIPRTDVENEAIKVIRLLSASYKTAGKEKTGKSFDFPAVVDQTLQISNLSFIEGLLQIQAFIDWLDR